MIEIATARVLRTGQMRIGVDFDNTIAGFDEVFLSAARHAGLIGTEFAGGKQCLRDALRARPGGELAWQRLQGQVYGAGMASAVLLDGVAEFLHRCKTARHELFIVSHKTEFGHHDPMRVNLRRAALDWMTARGFFRKEDFGIPVENVFFETTRREKLARIASLDCAHFIDDLEEVFLHTDFPPGVTAILFAERVTGGGQNLIHCKSWRQVAEVVFGERN